MSNSLYSENDKTKTKISNLLVEDKQKPQNEINLLRTDMASELLKVPLTNVLAEEVKVSKVFVDKALSKKIGKAEGEYITLESGIVKLGLNERYHQLSNAIMLAINDLTKNSKKIKSVLIVCLGNPNLTADALGAKVFDNLTITRHLPSEIMKGIKVSAICPNVFGATGIESFDIIKGVVDKILPDLIIAVDSLASAAVSRIGSAFQLCSSGITPGSGVANHRIRLDKSSLGVEVISIGVPLVVYATTIIAEAAGENAALSADNEIRSLIVTPKDIDLLVSECALVIAKGINMAFV